MLFITFITSCKTSSIKIWLVLTAGLAETLTQVVFRQPFVIQCVRTWFASCETWHFLFLYFFITIQSTSDLWCCCISSCCIRVIWWFELQKCMVKPYHTINPITLWEPVYDIFVPRFQPENSSFRLPYQRHSSSANCTKELFKGSNGSACLLVCTWKKIFWLGVADFFEWRHKWSSFRAILAHVSWPRTQPKCFGQSVLLKFSLETRLESKFFEPLIDFLAFLGPKLWSAINK